MARLILRRCALALFVVFAISIICFLLSHVAVDPAAGVAGDSATDEDLAAIRVQYGFDQPLIVQYGDYLTGVLRGDLGNSYLSGEPVSKLITERIPATALLAFLSIGFALALAVPLGVLAALRPNSWLDRLALTLAVVGQAVPNFWAGLLLILFFGVKLGWLPISGSATLAHFVLPAITLGSFAMPALMRLIRAGMIEVLEADYIRTARAMGLSKRKILFRYALRNAILPVISLTAVQFGFMLGGSIIVESVFAIQGVGYLAWQSMSRSDMPVIQAIVLFISLVYILLTLFADLLNAALDPRIREHA
ncbi:ABC-type dipeptide/oligopeptide/nickel transport system, permease component [Hoeflea sp. IMCC20628]|uniref:ABC transporter permease n=1 Tax=Hoeflea sp. IMCC20628 TaxID=1620421 RepID=UPI00063AD601|nr:ABC transporter permease [Hoeflea sp. IMCC20628]AKI01868.1 ABC-type dipeptide/oligopeptide/nickel transport system, permease component [Hoeflea sp. IMCC20628]